MKTIRKFYNECRAIILSEEGGMRKRVAFGVLITIIGAIIVFWFLYRLLKVDGHYNPNHKINLPDAGQVGDFIGGVVGTLFSLTGIILLYETLALQRKELESSRQVLEKQQFETTFFNLINLYQETLLQVEYETPSLIVGGSKIKKAKEYFEYQKNTLSENHSTVNSVIKDHKNAIEEYTSFYIANKHVIAHYFRTIYRVFKFVYETNSKVINKMSYAKIIRAQLTEGELFLLNYNLYTEYGKNWKKLDKEFNILKHLPLLEKMEYKKFKLKIKNNHKINSIGLFFDDLKKIILDVIETGETKHKTYLAGYISLKVVLETNTLIVTIYKNKNASFDDKPQQGYGLQDFSDVEIEELLKIYLMDLFVWKRHLDFVSKKTISTEIEKDTNGKQRVIAKIDLDILE